MSKRYWQVAAGSKGRKIAESLLALPIHERKPEPEETQEINDSQILEFLIAEGLRPSAADELTNTFRRIRLLADFYYNNCEWDDIREHETRTFLIVPLLLALGWAEQQMKVEYPADGGRVDLACFSRAYNRDGAKCILILESKDFASGLDYAPDQARRYAKAFPSCSVLVVSNGYCYKAYVRDPKTGFSQTPSAYLNLLKPTNRYPLAGTIQLERVNTVWRACGDETKSSSRTSTGGGPNGAPAN